MTKRMVTLALTEAGKRNRKYTVSILRRVIGCDLSSAAQLLQLLLRRKHRVIVSGEQLADLIEHVYLETDVQSRVVEVVRSRTYTTLLDLTHCATSAQK